MKLKLELDRAEEGVGGQVSWKCGHSGRSVNPLQSTAPGTEMSKPCLWAAIWHQRQTTVDTGERVGWGSGNYSIAFALPLFVEVLWPGLDFFAFDLISYFTRPFDTGLALRFYFFLYRHPLDRRTGFMICMRAEELASRACGHLLDLFVCLTSP